jgi:hypothetical protein
MSGLLARGLRGGAGLWCLLMLSCAPLPEGGRIQERTRQALDPILHPASALWGDLLIEPGTFEADTGVRPWSGYWFPLSGNESESALLKLDRVTGRQALKWFRADKLHSDRPALPWEGRCDAWALASLLVPEPSAPLEIQGERFEVWEQQALWIHSFEELDPSFRSILGSRNDGDGGSPFEDLLPMELHLVVQKRLLEERLPFVLDRDPKPPVWNTPIWGARWTLSRDPEGDSFGLRSWRVAMDLYGVLPLDQLPIQPERRVVVLHYDYRLRGVPLDDGKFRVEDSEWLGASRLDHPDFVTLPLAKTPFDSNQHRSSNPEIDSSWLHTHFK